MGRSFPTLLVLGSTFLPSLGSAQTGRLLPALETLAAVAERTFTGRIVKVETSEFRTTAEGRDHREYLPAGYRLFRYTLTVRVDENILGKGEDTVVLRAEAQNERNHYVKWRDAEKSLLWTVGPARPDRWDSLSQYTQQAVGDASPRWLVTDLDLVSSLDQMSEGLFQLPLFTKDLDVVRSRKDALNKLRAYARSHRKGQQLFGAALPNDFVDAKGIPRNAYLYVVFPDDPKSRAAVQRAKTTP